VQKRIFGPLREEVTEGSRKLHNEELHNLYFARMIKSMRLKWARHVDQMGRQ
jgi:hypothetical protein